MPRAKKNNGKKNKTLLDPGEEGSAVEMRLDAKLRRGGWWFDVGEADRVCTFIERYCRHHSGEHSGQLFILDPWQRRHVRRLFGWRRPDGTRRYRRSHWWLPRKNGKSTICASMALYLMMADGEMGAQVYSAASSKAQARMVFDEARHMAEKSPELGSLLQIHASSIYMPSSGSVYLPLSGRPRGHHGFNIHGVFIDEMHSIQGDELYGVLSTGSGTRRQPLEFVISTAGDNVASFAYELWDYAIKARDGVIEDPEFLAIVYCAEESDDWRDPKTWHKANPGLGTILKLDKFIGEMKLNSGLPSRLATFKRLHLNIWAQSTQAWLSLPAWRKCLVKPRPIHEYRGKRCWAGLDLSSTTDLTAMAAVFDMEDGGPLEAACFFWVPADTAAERQQADDAQYVRWIEEGYIRATPGNVVDYDLVERDVARIAKYTELQDIAYDRWGASQIAQRLQDVHGITLWQHGQGYRDMSPPAKELERLILKRGLRIVENPVLTWMASSVCVTTDPAGNIKPVKRVRKNRIDGIVALIMALGRATEREASTSVYQSRGLIQL